MQEIELKFNIPVAKQVNVERQIATKTAKTQELFACYFDTHNNLLAKQGIALRIRYENDQWVQTLKTKGDGVAQRIEVNYPLTIDEEPSKIDKNKLKPDISKIDNLDIIAQLNTIMPMDELSQALQIKYFTDIKRLKRIIKKNQSHIEIAYDTGNVVANNQQFSVNEVEFELIKGQVADLILVTKLWQKRHQLYISTISKAQRGNLLLAEKAHAEPTKANLNQLNLDNQTSEFVFLQQIIKNCLAQILPNATAIADGSSDGNHVHQIRVGLRRLRTALKIFPHETIQSDWIKILKTTFSQLGEYRDREILKTKTQPMLEKLGSPHVEWSLDVPIKPIDAVKNADFQQVLLNLIDFTHLPPPSDSPKAKKIASKKLDKLFNQLVKNSENFAKLDTERQHDVRKDLKTLRYISEFVAPLFNQADDKKLSKNKQLQSFLSHLEPVQDVLGEYNDMAVGFEYYQQKAKMDPNALFAVGWFGGQQQHSAENCAKSLKIVKHAKKFW